MHPLPKLRAGQLHLAVKNAEAKTVSGPSIDGASIFAHRLVGSMRKSKLRDNLRVCRHRRRATVKGDACHVGMNNANRVEGLAILSMSEVGGTPGWADEYIHLP